MIKNDFVKEGQSQRAVGQSQRAVGESRQLAEFVASTTFTDLPADVVERMKLYLLDTLAAGLAGSQQPWSRMVLDAECDRGGSGPCRVLGSAGMMGPASAARPARDAGGGRGGRGQRARRPAGLRPRL